jgi:ATP-binding protein involved in chromosome partitioning
MTTTLAEKVIYVYSGKGGVGKSTICVNLAYAMAKEGYEVGIFDADLSGPSLPDMVKGIEIEKPRFDDFSIIPGKYGDVYVNSIGFISEPVEGGYWHGKYLEGALNQLLYHDKWRVEVLLIDMPPGNSEIHRILFSKARGKALLVTTPQDLSYSDTIRGVEMLMRIGVDICGVVENMSYYTCECGLTKKIFEGNTEEKLCKPYNINTIINLPIIPAISKSSNGGIPFIVTSNKDDKEVINFRNLGKYIFNEFHNFKSIRPTN